MDDRYQPKDYIERIELDPQSDGIADQREITVQSYQTNVAFNHDALTQGLDHVWLTPSAPLGVIERADPDPGRKQIQATLGLLGPLSVRAFDYDERRPLYFRWLDVIRDTVAIRYSGDDSGLLRFLTYGGGVRITEQRIETFHTTFLKIPEGSSQKQQFDLDRLRELCFGRFVDQLYRVRFGNVASKEYESIDHALYQSRHYIDPRVGRLQVIRNDPKVLIESFDSEIEVHTEHLVEPITVRFFISGLSGALRLRFPKITYRTRFQSIEEQARVFYGLVDETVRQVLDEDYYAKRRLTLAEMQPFEGYFPEWIDPAPFREALQGSAARQEFFEGLDLAENKSKWLPHLKAIDELLRGDVLGTDIADELAGVVRRDPGQAVRMLEVCRGNPHLYRLGACLADALFEALHSLPAELRDRGQAVLTAWAVDREETGWDVDPETGTVRLRQLRFDLEDLDLDALSPIIWKLTGLIHDRLSKSTGDLAPNLARYQWCMTAAKALGPSHTTCPAALRLVAQGRIPRSPRDADRLLERPVDYHPRLNEELLSQFGLPLWPCLSVWRDDGEVVLANDGVGAALAVKIRSAATDDSNGDPLDPFDLPAGDRARIPVPGHPRSLELTFENYGASRRVVLPVASDHGGAAAGSAPIRKLARAIDRKRLDAQRQWRQRIDPTGTVIGSSPALLKVFERIQLASTMDAKAAVLILGETGVGKTHIARLIHAAGAKGQRRAGPFKAVNAGASGGDPPMQRGEWIGYGPGHGIKEIDPQGKPGHLMAVNGGTLFVDEFALLSKEIQGLFLSVLDGHGIELLGGETARPDVRCIFATNEDVDAAMATGKLRPDLIARIKVRITLPPLRERRGDILLLARYFVGEGNTIAPRGLVALLRHSWPENVRELHNKMEAAVARTKIAGSTAISLEHLELPRDVVAGVRTLAEDEIQAELWRLADEIADYEGYNHGGGRQQRAAEILGMSKAQASKMYKILELREAPAA